MPFRIWVIGTRTSSDPAGKSILVPARAARDAAGAEAAAGAVVAAGACADGAELDGAAALEPLVDAATGAAAVPFTAWPPTAWPVRCVSTKFVTSSRVIRPPPPVPTIWAGVNPCSRRRRRTAGVIRASGLPGASWVSMAIAGALPAAAVAVGLPGTVVGELADDAAARSGRSSEPPGPSPGAKVGRAI